MIVSLNSEIILFLPCNCLPRYNKKDGWMSKEHNAQFVVKCLSLTTNTSCSLVRSSTWRYIKASQRELVWCSPTTKHWQCKATEGTFSFCRRYRWCKANSACWHGHRKDSFQGRSNSGFFQRVAERIFSRQLFMIHFFLIMKGFFLLHNKTMWQCWWFYWTTKCTAPTVGR